MEQDPRVLHHGTPNNSDQPRPEIIIGYCQSPGTRSTFANRWRFPLGTSPPSLSAANTCCGGEIPPTSDVPPLPKLISNEELGVSSLNEQIARRFLTAYDESPRKPII